MRAGVDARGLRTPRYVADFDSGVSFVRATARYLKGKDVPSLGVPPASRLLGQALAALPGPLRTRQFAGAGFAQGVPMDKLARLRAEDLAAWVARRYGHGPYPAIVLGSSSGALVHLCAALTAPFIAQTLLVPVRQSAVHPDEPRQAMEAGSQLGRLLVRRNPELQLHHMHDPSQDRPMTERMMYFRVKRLRLGLTLERFIEERLAPDGTLLLFEAEREWPATRLGERHFFQHGALGGTTREDYFDGTDRVARFLERLGSHRRRWDPPEPTGEYPEAEWGFAPPLRDDVERLAKRRGYRLRRIAVEEPEHLSPLVADLYRWWYRRRGIPGDRLLVEGYSPVEPYWALRTGSVPFWTKFNDEPSERWLARYLDESEPYDEIYAGLFSQGLDSPGTVPIERWRALIDRARVRGDFVGVNERAYPSDLGYPFRFQPELKRKLAARHPLPGPLPLSDLEAFLERAGERYPASTAAGSSAYSRKNSSHTRM